MSSTTAVYDAFTRLVEIQGSSGDHTQMVYAPDGFKFAYMNGQTVEKYIAPLAAGLQAVYLAATPAAPAFWRHSDWLGTVRLDSTPAQGVYFDGGWAPFGEYYAGTGTSDRVFTGQRQDVVGGIWDFMFRQYSPAQGRWMVPDPAGLAAVDITNPQTWNRYAYVGNNPLSNVDPLGLNWIDGNGGCDYTGDSNCDDSSGPDCGIGICPIFPPIPCCGGDPGPSPNPTPAPTPAPQQPINFPNETLGLPNGFPTNPWGVWGAIIPTAQCGDITCPSIGSGFGPEEGVAGWVICQFAEPCGGIVDAVIVGGLVLDAGLVTYQYFSKKADLKTAEAARNRVAQICGKPIDRRKFHDLVTGQGLDYQEMVTEGVSWFCPEKAGKN